MVGVAIVGFMKSEAPNFNGSYPLAGERIGPAWRDLWTLLADDQWQCGTDLASAVGSTHNLAEATVKNLLRSAARAGLLETTLAVPAGRTREAAHYRVISCTVN